MTPSLMMVELLFYMNLGLSVLVKIEVAEGFELDEVAGGNKHLQVEDGDFGGHDDDSKLLELKKQETSIGWDPSKKTVDAPPEWWQSKIQENPEYLKFRDMGIFPDMMDIYDKMFKGSSALGHCVMIPSTSIDVEEVVEDSEFNVISADDEEDPELGNEDRGKKRTNEDRPAKANKDKGVMRGPKGKKAKVGGTVKLSKQIYRLVEVVESRSTATSVHTNSQGTSIQEVMQVVASLPGAETGTKLWWPVCNRVVLLSREAGDVFSYDRS
ncbi:uncharacterized protein LOC133730651 [Rosa rugosa]|uniref:uncharacterized protein LOC133730651 n=1 Tax=Rosa rugosa TaxID=74645 RepID=UPI002B411775|nr:uncharacterized protein LOC133730651 [Rosa rugosa]